MTSIVSTGCRTAKGRCSKWPGPSLLRALNITGISKWAATSSVINFMSSQHSVTNLSWNISGGWGIPECAEYRLKADEPARKVICRSAKVHPWVGALLLFIIHYNDNNACFHGIWILQSASTSFSAFLPHKGAGGRSEGNHRALEATEADLETRVGWVPTGSHSLIIAEKWKRR